MITNIIRDIIKDFPSVANSTVKLVCVNKENNEFTVAPTTDNNLNIVVQSTPGAAKSVEDWKKKMITDSIYIATQPDTHTADGKPITMSALADMIDKFINMDVVLWQL